MNNKLFRNVLVVGIIFLFLSASFTTNIIADSNVIYKTETNNEITFLYPDDQLDQQQTSHDELAVLVCRRDNNYYSKAAQSFKPTLNILTRVELKLYKGESVEGYLNCSIRNSLDSNDLTSTSIKAADIREKPGAWYEFDFPDINITTEETYYIILGTDNYQTECYWGLGIDNPYTRGDSWWCDKNNPWTLIEDYSKFLDTCFRTYGYKIGNPPSAPTITGPNDGISGTSYEFIFNAVDPDGDQVKYLIDWGDSKTDKTIFNPSGIDVIVVHTWDKKGTYVIKVRVQDSSGLVGPETKKSVSMPRSRVLITPLLTLMENYLNLLPFFQKLLNTLE
jgi:hypothetical protein